MFTLKIKTAAVVKPNRFEFQVLNKVYSKSFHQPMLRLCTTHTPKQTGAGSSFGALQVVNKHLLQAACWQQICYWHVYLFIYLSIYPSSCKIRWATVAEKKGEKKHKLSMNCGWCSRKQCSGFSKQTITPLLFFFPFGADAVQGLLGGGTQGAMFNGGDKRQRICKDSSMGSSFCIEHTQNKWFCSK